MRRTAWRKALAPPERHVRPALYAHATPTPCEARTRSPAWSSGSSTPRTRRRLDSSPPTPPPGPPWKRRVPAAAGVGRARSPVRLAHAPRALDAGPRTPSSPLWDARVRSRVHGTRTPRTPGGMWAPPSPPRAPSPPTIVVSPPEADVAAIVAQCGPRAPAPAVRPEWQFAFVSALLARDHAAMEQLAWKLDAVVAQLASRHAECGRGGIVPPERLARHAARECVVLLSRAWKPHSWEDHKFAPPSFRHSSCVREAPHPADATSWAHAQWAQRLSDQAGAELVDRIARHLVSGWWYLAVSDPQRSFERATMGAHVCVHVCEYLRRWERHELALGGGRRLPSTELSARASGGDAQLTSTLLRRAVLAALHDRFAEIRAPTPEALAVPPRGSGAAPAPAARAAEALHPDADGSAIVDAARFLGELVRLGLLPRRGIVAQWLRALLLHTTPWVQVPLYQWEAGCALLLLTGDDNTAVEAGGIQRGAARSSSSPAPEGADEGDAWRDLCAQCLVRLEQLEQAPLWQDSTRTWLQFVNEARARAEAWKPDESEPYARAFFADQFESEANFFAHYHHTGPEIWRQTGGQLDAFVAGTGTGGTVSGVATYLKEMAQAHPERPPPRVVVADPHGSGVYNRIKFGVMYSATEAEGTRRRHQVDTVVEGIGLNRLTHNLEMGLRYIDDAERVSDDEAVRMSRWLAKHDGLFLGSSSAVHCVAAVRTALRLKKERAHLPLSDRPIVVTILYVSATDSSADSGTRHLSKFHNDAVMEQRGLNVSEDISDILGVAP